MTKKIWNLTNKTSLIVTKAKNRNRFFLRGASTLPK